MGLTPDLSPNVGFFNTGTNGVGILNTGQYNVGISNSGFNDVGYGNTGTVATGFQNTGTFNFGYRNTGTSNSGFSNAGNNNSGGHNVGGRPVGILQLDLTWSTTNRGLTHQALVAVDQRTIRWFGLHRRDRGPGRPGAHPDRPPEPAAQQRRDGRRHERPHDQGVEQQAQTDGGAHLADHSHVTDHHGRHREGEHQPGVRHDFAGAAHGSDDARIQAGVYLLFEPGDQQQVVVRPHGQQHDDGHRHAPASATGYRECAAKPARTARTRRPVRPRPSPR